MSHLTVAGSIGVKKWIETISPGSFAAVMATGIVSIAAGTLGLPLIARVLFGLNVALYLVLWAITLLRLLTNPRALLLELTDHVKAFAYFTTAAGSGVLGLQFLIGGKVEIAASLWLVTVALWAFLTYAIFTVTIVKRSKPSIATGLDGGWLLTIVATQSVASLGARVAVHFPDYTDQVLFASLAAWLGGGALYFWIISLVFYQLTFSPLASVELKPSYWINAGAMAISTLAGTSLMGQAGRPGLLSDLGPILKAGSITCWAVATWWIPLLVVLSVWRHAVLRHRFKYDQSYWSAVFPLGMYGVCTHRIAQALELTFLSPIAATFSYLALLAWTATSIGAIGSFICSRQAYARKIERDAR